MTEGHATVGAPAVEPVVAPHSWASWRARYQVVLVLGDLAIAGLAAGLAMALQVGRATPFGAAGSIGLLLALLAGWPALLYLGRCYDDRYLGAGTEELRRVANSGVRVLAAIAVTAFVFKIRLARSFVGISVPLVVVGSLLWHLTLRGWLNRARRRGRGLHRVLIVGRHVAAERMVEALSADTGEGVGLTVVGTCADPSEIVPALAACGADTVAVASESGLTPTELRRLGWQLEGSSVDLLVGTDLIEVAGPRIHVRPVAGLPLLHVEEPELRGVRRFVKASYDRLLAALALVLLSPVLLAIAVVVRLDSPGPAIYRQERIGRHGRTFRIVKFRSMTVDADSQLASLALRNEHDGPLFKMRADPRVTRAGRWLRRTSVDELPQLWNVVRGEMSLVGPRPPLPSEVSTYADDVRRRLLVKPGVTGLWQVSGRANLSWEQSVRLDLSYVENWSPALDFSILVKTLRAVLARSGAY